MTLINELVKIIKRIRYKEVLLTMLADLYPCERGLSSKSFRSYCNSLDINSLTDKKFRKIVHYLVSQCGHSYGRQMMQGSIHILISISSDAVIQ